MEKRSTSTPSSASLTVHAKPASPPPITITRFFAVAMVSFGSPHLFTHLGPLLMNEFEMVFQMARDVAEQLVQSHWAVLAVVADARERAVRQLAQHRCHLPPRQFDELHRVFTGLIFIVQCRGPLVLIEAGQRRIV